MKLNEVLEGIYLSSVEEVYILSYIRLRVSDINFEVSSLIMEVLGVSFRYVFRITSATVSEREGITINFGFSDDRNPFFSVSVIEPLAEKGIMVCVTRDDLNNLRLRGISIPFEAFKR